MVFWIAPGDSGTRQPYVQRGPPTLPILRAAGGVRPPPSVAPFAQPSFQLGPAGFGRAVGTCNPGGGAGVDAATIASLRSLYLSHGTGVTLRNPAKARALRALRDALLHFRPTVQLDEKGYAVSFRDVLLPLVALGDFEADLRSGDGNELETKFRAAHSSSALAVNSFAPFRTRASDMVVLDAGPFEHLQFERKCQTGLRGGGRPISTLF